MPGFNAKVKTHTILGTAHMPMKLKSTVEAAAGAVIAIATTDQTPIADMGAVNTNITEMRENNLELRFFNIHNSGDTAAVAEIYLYPCIVSTAGGTQPQQAGICYARVGLIFTSGLLDAHPITAVSTTDWNVADGVDIVTGSNFALWPPSVLSNTLGREAPFSFDMRGYRGFDVRIIDVASTDVGEGVIVGYRGF